MSLCAYLSHMIWIKLVANPTFTVVESTHYSMDNVILPAVAVCISEIDTGSNTENITRILTQANDNVKLEAGKEISEALELTVNTETISTKGISSDSVPNLYVFDSQNKLTLLDSSIILTARAYFDINVAVWIIESSEDVRSLSLPNRKCFLIENTENEADSYQSCITLYLLQKVVTHCRCLPFKYSAQELKLEEFPLCSWERLKCIYNMLDKIQSHIRNIMSEKECYQKCDLVQYETKTSYYNMDKNDKLHFSQTQHSCRVAVHFADNTCIKYRREVLYTWDQMLANLGAIFGLCLGGSIVSLIELLLFLLELLFMTLYWQRKKVVPHNSRTNKIFTLTSKQTQNQFKSKYPYMN
ncbi:uncharacterized protein LOC133319038 [Danaus plexippus]|uniref:uncharacterized protein LOC133319038 n=1 Tax=Danaus plexippus TaxID=13037 RepID=UPI002AB1C1CC|nr:uncharacterized protein LOC133319038 [Danaus plexippus]